MSALHYAPSDRVAPTRPLGGTRMRWHVRRRDLILGVAGIVGVLGIWQLAGTVGFVDPDFSSTPTRTLAALIEMVRTGEIWGPTASTMKTIAIGVGLSIAVGIPLGLVIGRTPVLRELTDPWVSILYSVPYVVFLPIIIFWVGIGQGSRVVLVVWGAIFPLLINTIAAARNLDVNYLHVGRVFSASRLRTLRSIVFPATLPYVLAGVRLAVGRGLVAAIVAEIFMGTEGLGYVVQTETSNFDMDSAMAAITVIAVVAIALTRTVGYLERRFTYWSESA
jgi:ABC-type nitrate/sulfonate/bicarbonate transport system permease component